MLTLQDIIKIQEKEQKHFQNLKERLANIDNRIDALFDNKKGMERIKVKLTMDTEKLFKYNTLKEERKLTETEIEKHELILLCINDYIKNIKLALAYNYYIDELQRRPKIHNKPLSYKVVKNALKEIHDTMPGEIIYSFYDLEFTYNKRYYAFHNLLTTNNSIDSAKLIKLDINIIDPITLAENNYNTYCKMLEILQVTHRKINELEQTLENAEIMQYNKGSIAYNVEVASRCLPYAIYRNF